MWYAWDFERFKVRGQFKVNKSKEYIYHCFIREYAIMPVKPVRFFGPGEIGIIEDPDYRRVQFFAYVHKSKQIKAVGTFKYSFTPYRKKRFIARLKRGIAKANGSWETSKWLIKFSPDKAKPYLWYYPYKFSMILLLRFHSLEVNEYHNIITSPYADNPKVVSIANDGFISLVNQETINKLGVAKQVDGKYPKLIENTETVSDACSTMNQQFPDHDESSQITSEVTCAPTTTMAPDEDEWWQQKTKWEELRDQFETMWNMFNHDSHKESDDDLPTFYVDDGVRAYPEDVNDILAEMSSSKRQAKIKEIEAVRNKNKQFMKEVTDLEDLRYKRKLNSQ